MNGNPVLRLWVIALSHRYLLLVSSLLGFLGGSIVGLTSPKLYTAEATLKIDPPKKSRIANPMNSLFDAGNDSAVAIRNATTLLTSKEVLEAAMEKLGKDKNFDPKIAFPNAIRATDFRTKWQLAAKRLSNRPGDNDNIPIAIDLEILTGLLRNQIQVIPDPEAQTVRIGVISSTGDLAQRMCAAVSDRYMALALEHDKEELTKEEAYLRDTLEIQKHDIETVEGKIRDIRKEHPEVAPSIEQAGRSPFAVRNLEIRGELTKVDGEIRVIERLQENELQSLGKLDFEAALKSEAVRKRLEKELDDIEFQRVEYTKILGYQSDHPDIAALDQRAAKLKEILRTLRSHGEGGMSPQTKELLPERSVAELMQQAMVNREKLLGLRARETELKADLAVSQEAMKRDLPIESEVASLARELTAHLEVSTELRRHLEEIRIQLVGFQGSATLLLPPILPVVPTSLSIPKRAAFGLVVGLAFALTALFLIDLGNPRLRLTEDLEALHISHFGVFHFHVDSVMQFASCLLSLKKWVAAPDRLADTNEALGKVVLFTNVASQITLDSWLQEVAKILDYADTSAGVLIIEQGLSGGVRRQSGRIDGIEVTRLHVEEVPFVYEQIIAGLRKKYAWILVLCSQVDQGPSTLFMARSAAHIFYVSRLGHSELRILSSYQKAMAAGQDAPQHALIFTL